MSTTDGMDDLTRAYASGRSDQFEDDCAVVKLLLDECDDAVAVSDGRLNVMRIRDLLESHFKPGQCFPDACSTPNECEAMGCRKESEARRAARKANAEAPS